jgi:predicted DNA-binding antitoxin AbrB/MazE fold protein
VTQVLMATYEDGVFRPREPVQLPVKAHVRLTVDLLDSEVATGEQQAKLASLEELWRTSSLCSTEPYLTRDQLHERR